MQWNYNHKITGLIQNVFDGDKTTKQKIVGKKLIYFPREGGVGGGTPPWKIENNLSLKAATSLNHDFRLSAELPIP